MEPLPAELFLEIISFFPGYYVFKIRLVSKEWNSVICESPLLWKSLLLKEFNDDTSKSDSEKSYMEVYKNRAR